MKVKRNSNTKKAQEVYVGTRSRDLDPQSDMQYDSDEVCIYTDITIAMSDP